MTHRRSAEIAAAKKLEERWEWNGRIEAVIAAIDVATVYFSLFLFLSYAIKIDRFILIHSKSLKMLARLISTDTVFVEISLHKCCGMAAIRVSCT